MSLSQYHRRKENFVVTNPIEYEIAKNNLTGLSEFFGFGRKGN